MGAQGKLKHADDDEVLFKDVAGIDDAKRELQEVVDFFNFPERYRRSGARQPRGILLYGPPGTGKTLLARAVAGEAAATFLGVNASEFVEMFMGVGASRVRDLFSLARENAPAVIFIDELDAVGRVRGSASGNDERDQTINMLLSELDGFDARSGVVVMAATNRRDVLDPALVRAGRFDRQVRAPAALRLCVRAASSRRWLVWCGHVTLTTMLMAFMRAGILAAQRAGCCCAAHSHCCRSGTARCACAPDSSTLEVLRAFQRACDDIDTAWPPYAHRCAARPHGPPHLRVQVFVGAPSRDGRVDVIKIHLARYKYDAASVRFTDIAYSTEGYTGSSIANLCNVAAIMARRDGRDTIVHDDFVDGIIYEGAGHDLRPHNDRAMTRVAMVQAASALAAVLLPTLEPVDKVFTLPKERSKLGCVQLGPAEHRMLSGLFTRRYLEVRAFVLGSALRYCVFVNLSSFPRTLNDLFVRSHLNVRLLM